MPIPRPITKTKIGTVEWGIPITDIVNMASEIVAPTWKPIPLAAGMTVFGSGFQPPRYFVAGNFVMLDGMIRNSTGADITANWTLADNLPVEMRPTLRVILGVAFATTGGTTVEMARLDINGAVMSGRGTLAWPASQYVSLTGLCYHLT